MNIIKKIILFAKNMFIKQNKLPKLQEPKIFVDQCKTESFIESLKVATTGKETKRKIEILTCEGDGLGIRKKITC